MDGKGDHSGYDRQSSFDEDGVNAGSCDYSVRSDAFELGSNESGEMIATTA